MPESREGADRDQHGCHVAAGHSERSGAARRCTGDATATIATTKIQGIVQELSEGNVASLMSLLPDETYLMKSLAYAVIAILMLVVAYFVAKLMSRAISGALCKRVDETLGKFAGRSVFYAVIATATLGILGTAGINVTSIAAILTAAGFAIGLAFQGTLSNVSAGVLLLVFRPFKVGDMIVAAGVTGRVHEIDLFTTALDTPDNRRLIVPNSAIAGATVENMTFHAHRRIDVLVGVDYKADLQVTRDVLTNAVEALKGRYVEGENRGYQILLTNLGNSSVEWTLRVWVPTSEVGKVREQITQSAKLHLDQAGISIPFPQLHLHFDHEPEATVAAIDQATTRVRPRLRHPMSDVG